MICFTDGFDVIPPLLDVNTVLGANDAVVFFNVCNKFSKFVNLIRIEILVLLSANVSFLTTGVRDLLSLFTVKFTSSVVGYCACTSGAIVVVSLLIKLAIDGGSRKSGLGKSASAFPSKQAKFAHPPVPPSIL